MSTNMEGRTSSASHWNGVYRMNKRESLGWFAPSLDTSLSLIQAYSNDLDSSILDIGGGSSSLVDDLLARGFSNLSVLDISQIALDDTRSRLGATADAIDLICADIRSPSLNLNEAMVWHDRAVFHFLWTPEELASYRSLLLQTLAPGGKVILGVFSENAPPKCSGLPVNRHSLKSLLAVFGDRFTCMDWLTEIHITPGGVEQEYLYSVWQIQD